MSEGGKKTSIYVGDPIQTIKARLREAKSPMTLSARINQMAARYEEFIADAQGPSFTQRELASIRRALDGIEVTPTIIRNLEGLVDDNILASRLEDMPDIYRLMLVEELGL